MNRKSKDVILSRLDRNYDEIYSRSLTMISKYVRGKHVRLVLLAHKQKNLSERRDEKFWTLGVSFRLKVWLPLSCKLLAEPVEIFPAIVWERHCTFRIRSWYRSLEKCMDRIVYLVRKETRLYWSSAQSKWVPCKYTSVAVTWAQFMETENTQNDFFVGVQ